MELIKRTKPIKAQYNTKLELNKTKSEVNNPYVINTPTNQLPWFDINTHKFPAKFNKGMQFDYTAPSLISKRYKPNTPIINPFTGEVNYSSEIPSTYASTNSNNSFKIGSMLKPAIGAATFAYNMSQLEKTKNAAKNLITPTIHTAQTNVRPIQQLAPEILNGFQANLGALQIDKSFDPTRNIIANQMLNNQKIMAINNLAAQQAQNLIEERARHDAALTKNAELAAKGRTDSSKMAADVHNKLAGIDATYEKAKQETGNKAVHDVMDSIYNRAMYNAAAKKSDALNTVASIQQELAYENQTLAALGGKDPNAISTIISNIKDIKARLATAKAKVPNSGNYNTVMGGAFSFKTGGKLIPKKYFK